MEVANPLPDVTGLRSGTAREIHNLAGVFFLRILVHPHVEHTYTKFLFEIPIISGPKQHFSERPSYSDVINIANFAEFCSINTVCIACLRRAPCTQPVMDCISRKL